MQPLRYSINVTLDGCCDHREGVVDEDLHRNAVENIGQADALLFGRVTYEMMEAAWRPPARTGARPDWMEPWMEPFARTIDAAKKYVVSSTLDRVDWNAELVRGDLGKAVQQLKRESGKGLFVGGVKLPQALAELGIAPEILVTERGYPSKYQSLRGSSSTARSRLCKPSSCWPRRRRINRYIRRDADRWVTLAARSPIRPGRRHSRAARSRDIVRVPNAFPQHPAAAVPRLAPQLQPAQAGPECDKPPYCIKQFVGIGELAISVKK